MTSKASSLAKKNKMYKIDLNSDLGESFGAYKIGRDSDIVPLVSSANVACGFHAGDPSVMWKTVKLCKESGTAVCGPQPESPGIWLAER